MVNSEWLSRRSSMRGALLPPAGHRQEGKLHLCIHIREKSCLICPFVKCKMKTVITKRLSALQQIQEQPNESIQLDNWTWDIHCERWWRDLRTLNDKHMWVFPLSGPIIDSRLEKRIEKWPPWYKRRMKNDTGVWRGESRWIMNYKCITNEPSRRAQDLPDSLNQSAL